MLPRIKKEEFEGEGIDSTVEEKKDKKRKSTGDQGVSITYPSEHLY